MNYYNGQVFGLSYFDYKNNRHEMFRLKVPIDKVRGRSDILHSMPMDFTQLANEVYLLSPERKVLKCRQFSQDSEEANHEVNFIGYDESHTVDVHELSNILSTMFGRPVGRNRFAN